MMRTILPHQENPALREKAQDIPLAEIGSERIRTLVTEMKELLSKEEYGVALAAPQLGEPLRLFVVSGRALARDNRNTLNLPAPAGEPGMDEESTASPPPGEVYINPELLRLSRKKTGKHEGCLSIRGKWGVVPRAEKATIRARDERGHPFTRGASGFLAHILQHEMDHLEGILYIDKATELYLDDAGETGRLPASDSPQSQ